MSSSATDDKSVPTSLATAMSGAPTDTSGIDTFNRYVWQAKLALILWLTCLKDRSYPVAVVCERIDDVVVLYEDRLRFIQLKTRDRGSWSAIKICTEGYGIDALVRSYLAARSVKVHDVSVFELWLEGPMASAKQTANFFTDPRTAPTDLRNRIVALGLPKAQVSDFLKRLVIVPNQPARAYIDSVILQNIGALWPSLTSPEMQDLFDSLIALVAAAQGGHVTLGHKRFLDEVSTAGDDQEFDARCVSAIAALGVQTLTRDQLRTATPPLPTESDDELLQRLAAGTSATALELKMRRAGVMEGHIQTAQNLRATAEFKRQTLLAASEENADALDRLSNRLLTYASAVASRGVLLAAGNPAMASRPGQYIMDEILSSPSDVIALDGNEFFDRDTSMLFGLICQLSDECKFWFGVS